MANPWKYLYDSIKENHPDFVSADDKDDKGDKKVEDKLTADEILKRKKTPADTQDTIADLGGGDGEGTGGWTEAKIDAIEENSPEFRAIPKKIYNQYMMGELK